jgi:hypothetical protein
VSQSQRLDKPLPGLSSEHVLWQETDGDDLPPERAPGERDFPDDRWRMVAQLLDEVRFAVAPLKQKGGLPAAVEVVPVAGMNEKGKPGWVVRQMWIHGLG